MLVHASSHPHSHPCVRFDRLFSPFFLTLFSSVCFSYLFFFCLNLDFLSLPLPCELHRGNIPLALRQMRSLALWSTTRHSQVMSPTSSTISTTQRPLKSSSRSNPATRCPRTCMTRRSATTSSAERSLHHCSLMGEKNQRTVDNLFALLKNFCCQVSPCLTVM